MNRESRNTIVWAFITFIYAIGTYETIIQGYTGWISIMLFVPGVIALAYTCINAKGADLFVGYEEEE